jgi:hypothetical protein
MNCISNNKIPYIYNVALHAEYFDLLHLKLNLKFELYWKLESRIRSWARRVLSFSFFSFYLMF